MACSKLGIIVYENGGYCCEHWVPYAMGPKISVERGEGGTARIVVLRTKAEEERSNCIAKLAQLLHDAEKGELRDVLVVGFRPDDEVTLHWTPMTDANGFKFVGALHRMAHLLMDRMKITSES